MEIWSVIAAIAAVIAVIPVLGWARGKVSAKLEDRKTRLSIIPALEVAGLQEVVTNLNLRKGERCYYSAAASLVVEKNVRSRASYHGPVVRVRLAPGLSYRAAMIFGGSRYEKRRVKSTQGILYLTNRRIIFRGDSKNETCDLDRVLEFQWFTNRVIRIDKQWGSPLIVADVNARLVGYYFDRLAGTTSAG